MVDRPGLAALLEAVAVGQQRADRGDVQQGVAVRAVHPLHQLGVEAGRIALLQADHVAVEGDGLAEFQGLHVHVVEARGHGVFYRKI